jgi:two-component system sensor histidine kinase TctE
MVSGFAELPFWRGRIPDRSAYAALVDFYDAQFRNQPVRVAVLLQPVASARGRGMAVVQVAETLELRETLARKLLLDTLWRQAAADGRDRAGGHLRGAARHAAGARAGRGHRAAAGRRPLAHRRARRAARAAPLIDATTEVMGRLQHLLDHQKRFVRDSAHQLRTPLAVLKAQVQSARRGDVAPEQALARSARRSNAPPRWPTRCCRWPRWSSCASSPSR